MKPKTPKVNPSKEKRPREYKVTLNDDEMAIIHKGLLELVKRDYDNLDITNPDIKDFMKKLAVLLDVFMAW
jgi:hypothetical protein